MLHYYAQRKAIKNGEAQTPTNYSYGDSRKDAEKQFFLLCANAITNGDGFDIVSVEYGTIEQGAIERRFYDNTEEAAEATEDQE